MRVQIESTKLENEKLKKEVESAQLLVQKAGHLGAQHADENDKYHEVTFLPSLLSYHELANLLTPSTLPKRIPRAFAKNFRKKTTN